MQSELVFGGVPKRLIEKNGSWTLEVLRQVAVDRSIYRPETRSLSGPDSILQYLRQDPQHEHLARAASELLYGPDAGEERSFEAVNGEWVPSNFIARYKAPTPQRAASQTVGARVKLLAVQTECLRLRHQYAELSNRVKYLEGLVERLATGGPVEFRAESREEPSSASTPTPSTPTPASSRGGEAPRPEPVARSSGSVLQMPDAEVFTRCLEQLIGGDVSAKASKKTLDMSRKGQVYIATLTTDGGDVVGAVVMDLKSTVHLGGTLLMIPDSDLDAQVEAGTASEDCMAASAELCNSFGAKINDAAPNTNLHTAMLTPFDPEFFTWLKSANESLTLEDSGGGLILIALK